MTLLANITEYNRILYGPSTMSGLPREQFVRPRSIPLAARLCASARSIAGRTRATRFVFGHTITDSRKYARTAQGVVRPRVDVLPGPDDNGDLAADHAATDARDRHDPVPCGSGAHRGTRRAGHLRAHRVPIHAGPRTDD